MLVHNLRVASALAAVIALSAAAYAGDAADPANADSKELLDYVKKLEARVSELEHERESPLDSIRAQSGAGSALESAIHSMNFTGYLEMQYGYNLRHGNGGVTGRNAFRGAQTIDNGFSFQNLELMADKPLTTEKSTGFRARLDFGEVSKFNNRDATFNNSGNAFDVREAYFSWRAPSPCSALSYWDLSLGRFDSPLGMESADTNNLAANFGTVTRGLFHNLGTPATLTGARAVFPWMECARTTVYLVNGWDNVNENNDGKTLIVSHDMGHYEWMNSTLTFNVGFGAEGAIDHAGNARQEDGDKRKVFEFMWKGDADKDTQLGLDAFWVTSDKGRITNPVTMDVRSAHWHGVYGYAKHNLSKTSWVGARVGYYADDRFGVDATTSTSEEGSTTPGAQDLRVLDGSVSIGWDLENGAMVLLELRHEQALTNEPYRDASGNTTSQQDTVTASFIFNF